VNLSSPLVSLMKLLAICVAYCPVQQLEVIFLRHNKGQINFITKAIENKDNVKVYCCAQTRSFSLFFYLDI
jgi:hypothetical protein